MKRVTGKVRLVGVLVVFLCCFALTAHAVTIEYMTFLNPNDVGPRQAGLKKAIQDFEKKYPDIKVKVRVVPWHKIPEILIREAAAGMGPDVVRVAKEFIVHVSLANALHPLDDYVKNWTKEQREDFLAPWGLTVVNGKKMSLPLEHRVQVLYYRKDLLDEAGIKVPRSWEELGEACQKLTKGERAGLIVGLSRRKQASNLMQWLHVLVWSAGGRLYDEQGRGTFASEAGYKAFQFLYDLVHKYGMPKEALDMTVEEITLGNRAGTIAMSSMGSHRVRTSRLGKGVGLNMQTYYVPGPQGEPGAAYLTGWTLGIPKNAKDKDAAWKFIAHRMDPEQQLQYAKIGGEMPSRASVYDDEYFLTPPLGAEIRFWAHYIKKYSFPALEPPHYPELADILAVAASEIIAEKRPIKEILQKAQEKYNSQAGFK